MYGYVDSEYEEECVDEFDEVFFYGVIIRMRVDVCVIEVGVG